MDKRQTALIAEREGRHFSDADGAEPGSCSVICRLLSKVPQEKTRESEEARGTVKIIRIFPPLRMQFWGFGEQRVRRRQTKLRHEW